MVQFCWQWSNLIGNRTGTTHTDAPNTSPWSIPAFQADRIQLAITQTEGQDFIPLEKVAMAQSADSMKFNHSTLIPSSSDIILVQPTPLTPKACLNAFLILSA
jgi:hypothetical protein